MHSARILIACLGFASPALTQAAITSLDLGNYSLTATYDLPALASEASAVTWNWESDTLFVLGDEGDAVVEVSKTGVFLSSMTLAGFDDTEGLTYMGGGQFVLVEERLRNAYLLSYSPGGLIARSSLPWVSLGATVGNVGLEGISYDPSTGTFVTVKEKTPQAVSEATVTFATGASGGTATIASVFDPASLGLLDLSDVQVLSTVMAPGAADFGNLLIYSQESRRLLEVDRSGSVLSMFDFSAFAPDAEGVTIDADGNIYIVGETPRLYVLTPAPVPLPAAGWLLLSGLAGLGGVGLRRRRA